MVICMYCPKGTTYWTKDQTFCQDCMALGWVSGQQPLIEACYVCCWCVYSELIVPVHTQTAWSVFIVWKLVDLGYKQVADDPLIMIDPWHVITCQCIQSKNWRVLCTLLVWCIQWWILELKEDAWLLMNTYPSEKDIQYMNKIVRKCNCVKQTVAHV